MIYITFDIWDIYIYIYLIFDIYDILFTLHQNIYKIWNLRFNIKQYMVEYLIYNILNI